MTTRLIQSISIQLYMNVHDTPMTSPLLGILKNLEFWKKFVLTELNPTFRI